MDRLDVHSEIILLGEARPQLGFGQMCVRSSCILRTVLVFNMFLESALRCTKLSAFYTSRRMLDPNVRL